MSSQPNRKANSLATRDLLVRQEPGTILIEGNEASLAALLAALEEVATQPGRNTVTSTTKLPDGRDLHLVRWPEE
jgi:hypothetical protein